MPYLLVSDLNMMSMQAGSTMASSPRSSGGSGFGGGGGAGGGFRRRRGRRLLEFAYLSSFERLELFLLLALANFCPRSCWGELT